MSGCGQLGAAVPGIPVGPAGDAVRELLRSSVAASTWATHGKSWQEWLCFLPNCAQLDRSSCLTATLALFGHLRVSGSSASLAKKRLSGVAFMLKLLGKMDVTREFLVKQVVRGWGKSKVACDMRRPISFLLLQRLLTVLGHVCADVYEALLFRSAFSLEFFGALRVSEFTAPNARSTSPLLASDVVLLRDSVRLRISRSKTDQYGQGTWLTISSLDNAFCPVRLLLAQSGA